MLVEVIERDIYGSEDARDCVGLCDVYTSYTLFLSLHVKPDEAAFAMQYTYTSHDAPRPKDILRPSERHEHPPETIAQGCSAYSVPSFALSAAGAFSFSAPVLS